MSAHRWASEGPILTCVNGCGTAYAPGAAAIPQAIRFHYSPAIPDGKEKYDGERGEWQPQDPGCVPGAVAEPSCPKCGGALGRVGVICEECAA